MTVTVNLFASPGTGKSTMAAGLFHQLKTRLVDCEIASEYAKDLVWSDRQSTLGDQYYIFGKQHHRVWNLQNKVDIVITDCPILLTALYADGYPQCFLDTVQYAHRCFESINYLLERTKPYNPKGRNQNEQQSAELQEKLVNQLNEFGVDFTRVTGDSDGLEQILADLEQLGYINEIVS